MIQLYIKREAAKRLRRGFPWVAAEDVVAWGMAADLPAGEWLAFVDEKAEWLGVGTFDPQAKWAGRLWSRGHESAEVLIKRAFGEAEKKRQGHFEQPYYRWIYSEADGLPGVVIDRFGQVVVMQCNTQGVWRLREVFIQHLQACGITGIVLRSDSRGAKQEGLLPETLMIGDVPEGLWIYEDDRRYWSLLAGGQKTGWYYDQRGNHRFLATQAKAGLRVLDVFAYQGGFGLAAAGKGAEVTLLDASAQALASAEKTAAVQGWSIKTQVADAWSFLRDSQESWDIIVVDPPALVTDRAHWRHGQRAYQQLIHWALHHLRPGGLLLMASCSRLVRAKDLQHWILAEAKMQDRRLRKIYQGQHEPDHPVLPQLAHMRYLDCVAYRCLSAL